jgi:hypothetical protein
MHLDAVKTLSESPHLYSVVDGADEEVAEANYYYHLEEMKKQPLAHVPVAEKSKARPAVARPVSELFLLSPEGEIVLANGAFGVPEVRITPTLFWVWLLVLVGFCFFFFVFVFV